MVCPYNKSYSAIRRNELQIHTMSGKANPSRLYTEQFHLYNLLENDSNEEQIGSRGGGEQEGNGFCSRRTTGGIPM